MSGLGGPNGIQLPYLRLKLRTVDPDDGAERNGYLTIYYKAGKLQFVIDKGGTPVTILDSLNSIAVADLAGLLTDVLLTTNKKFEFRDATNFINSGSADQLNIVGAAVVEITTPQLDIDATDTDLSGTLHVAGVVTAPGGLVGPVTGSVNGTVYSGAIVVLTPANPVALNAALGTVFTLVPDQTGNINASNVPAAGQPVTLIITTSGASSFTLTFNTGFKSTGTLATGTASGKVFVVQFISNGTTLIEVSRTAAM